MAITIKHAKTDTIADWTQTDLDAQIALGNFPPGTTLADIVLPSDWNNDHTLSGTVPIANGGTGQTTANAALNALLPSQSSNTGKVLSTDGTNTSWIAAGGTGTVTSVSGVAPVTVATGTTTPVISMAAATASVNGYLTSTDWTTFNSKAPATSGTSILYGNGSGGFSNVTVGSGLSFSAGTLSATGGSMVYPGAGIPNSTGTSWGTSYTTTGSGTIVALQTNPTLYNPNIDVIDFDTTYATTLTAGQLGWDGNNTLALGMAGGNVIQHIGEDLYFYCKATNAITKGQVVMFTGAVGASGVPTGAPATGITDGTYIMGIAAESIALNGFGLVQAFGELRNVNTVGYADGDILWYDPSVTGGLTKTKPSAPNVKAQMAAVINGGSSGGGTILIRIDPGSQLGGTDSNVQITSASNGQLLSYDGVAGYWKNTSLTAGTGISTSATAGVITVTNSAPDQTVSITGTLPISVTGTYPNFTASISQSNSTTNGYLSSTDWTTFNSKGSGTVTSVAALTLGTTGTDLSSSVANGTTTPVITLNVPTASATNRGALSAADWTTFNNKGNGTVTTLSVVSANGLAGTIANATTTPAITLSTTITGLLKGNGTAISAATSGTDYAPATSGSSILYGNGSGGFSNVTVGTGLSFSAGTLSSTTSGTVTSVSGTGTVAGISLSGTVTTSGSLTLGGTFALPSGQVTGKMIYDTFTATASQTSFTTSQTYTSGKIQVAVNGVILLNGTDCTVTSGTAVVMATGLTVGDIVTLTYPI